MTRRTEGTTVDGVAIVVIHAGGTLTLPRRINDPDRTPRWGQANIAA
jgi:hypothetical protein